MSSSIVLTQFNVSLFFAKFLGIYFTVISLIMLYRKDYVKALVDDYAGSPVHIFHSGVIGLFSGLFILLLHHVWAWNWGGLITLIGYLFTIKGLVRLVMGDLTVSYLMKFRASGKVDYLLTIMLLIGLYLIGCGFFNASGITELIF
jgi:hypothetical protein